jgi:hypothetical protein
VPAVSDVWVRQALHCHSARFSSSQCAKPSHAGHAKPSGQRQEKSASRQFPRFRKAARTPRPTGLVETAPYCVPWCTPLSALMISVIRKAESWRRIAGNQVPFSGETESAGCAFHHQMVRVVVPTAKENWARQLSSVACDHCSSPALAETTKPVRTDIKLPANESERGGRALPTSNPSGLPRRVRTRRMRHWKKNRAFGAFSPGGTSLCGGGTFR